jgi:hypothetical protein
LLQTSQTSSFSNQTASAPTAPSHSRSRSR